MPPIVCSSASSLSAPACGLLSARAVCDRVTSVVAGDFAIPPAALFARTRSPHGALARQIAMYLAHTVFAMSFGRIGRLVGRDRTTVAHACRRIEDAREQPGFDERLRQLELQCRDSSAVNASASSVTLKVVR